MYRKEGPDVSRAYLERMRFGGRGRTSLVKEEDSESEATETEVANDDSAEMCLPSCFSKEPAASRRVFS